MAKGKKSQAPDRLEEVESALSRTERYIEDNQKTPDNYYPGFSRGCYCFYGI